MPGNHSDVSIADLGLTHSGLNFFERLEVVGTNMTYRICPSFGWWPTSKIYFPWTGSTFDHFLTRMPLGECNLLTSELTHNRLSSSDQDSSHTGIFTLCLENTRQLPAKTDNVTHEMVHPSVLEQDCLSPQLRESIRNNQLLVCGLLPFEEEMKRGWPYVPGKHVPVNSKHSPEVEFATGVVATVLWSTTREVLTVGAQLETEINQTRPPASRKSTNGTAGKQSSTASRLMNLAHESHAAVVLKDIVKNHMH